MPDFAARLRKQLDDGWSNILIRRSSAEKIIALIEAAHNLVLRDYGQSAPDISQLRQLLREALRALDEE